MDNSVDTSVFFSINEEEEKEGVKLLFEVISQDLESFFSDQVLAHNHTYTFKKYSKPHLNLIFPPPDFLS